jgi:hypothetical protein
MESPYRQLLLPVSSIFSDCNRSFVASKAAAPVSDQKSRPPNPPMNVGFFSTNARLLGNSGNSALPRLFNDVAIQIALLTNDYYRAGFHEGRAPVCESTGRESEPESE